MSYAAGSRVKYIENGALHGFEGTVSKRGVYVRNHRLYLDVIWEVPGTSQKMITSAVPATWVSVIKLRHKTAVRRSVGDCGAFGRTGKVLNDYL